MKKRLLSFLLSLIMVFSMLSVTVLAAAALSVSIDGKAVATDVAPFIDANSRTMVPVRFITEALEAAVAWNEVTQTVTVTKGADTIIVVIDSQTLTVNGAAVGMDTAAMIKDGRTFVPVRYIAEALGLNVGWNSATQTVLLTTGQGMTAEEARTNLQSWLNNDPEVRDYYVLASRHDEYIDEAGEAYYLFPMESLTMYWANFLVNKNTGEMMFAMFFDGEFGGVEVEPLDEWYEKNYG